MSYNPHAFGSFLPTGGSSPDEFSLYHEYFPSSFTLSPNDHAVVVPARQQYSHSASDGRRIRSVSLISFASRSRFVAFSQKALASSQLTRSMPLRRPWNFAGLWPTTTWYSSCVTSYLAMAKEYLKVTLCAGRSLSSPPFSEPIMKLSGNLPLPGVMGTNSSANSLRMASLRGVGSSSFF